MNQFFVQTSRTKTATVTICDAPVGKKKKTSWVWHVMQEFAPPINNKNVRCIVMRGFTAVGPERWDQGADEPRGAAAPWRICQTEAAQCAG